MKNLKLQAALRVCLTMRSPMRRVGRSVPGRQRRGSRVALFGDGVAKCISCCGVKMFAPAVATSGAGGWQREEGGVCCASRFSNMERPSRKLAGDTREGCVEFHHDFRVKIRRVRPEKICIAML